MINFNPRQKYVPPTLLNLPLDLLKVIVGFLKPEERHPFPFICKRFSFISAFPKKKLYLPGIVAGSIIYLNWIKLQKYPLKTSDYKQAIRTGQIEILKWFKENRCDRWDACEIAARFGNLIVLKWLTENGYSLNERCCNNAAKEGHLETLKWLNEMGINGDFRACAGAAGQGHLETLKWLRKNGCPWNEYTCSFAASNGHLETLKWLRENGCPWNEYACTLAARCGHLETLKWLRENRCPWDRDYCFKESNGSTRQWILECNL